VHSAGESAGRLRDGSRRGGRLSGRDRDQSRLAVEGDDLGGAATGLLLQSRSRGGSDDAGGHHAGGLATLVESVMATVNTVGHGRAHHGGGGEDSSLHVGDCPHKKNECPLNE
jgi:hypothetical protein